MDENSLKIINEKFDCKVNMKTQTFLKVIYSHVDIELLRIKPFIWQDIWVYNYLMYEIKRGMRPTKLITKYEKQIVLPQRELISELKGFVML